MKRDSQKGELFIAKCTNWIINYSLLVIMEVLGFTPVSNLYADTSKPVVKSASLGEHLCLCYLVVYLIPIIVSCSLDVGTMVWPTKTKYWRTDEFKLPETCESWTLKELVKLCKPMYGLSVQFAKEWFFTDLPPNEIVVMPAMLWHGFPLPLTLDMTDMEIEHQ